MPKLREISHNHYGNVRVVVTDDKTVLFSLQDICKLFTINLQLARASMDANGIYEIPQLVENRKTKKVYVEEFNLGKCLEMSTDTNADGVYAWLVNVKNQLTITVGGYTVEDLKDEALANTLLHRLRELETIVAVQELRIEEDQLKVKMIDKLYGSNTPDLSLIDKLIVYKGISLDSILDDLRSNGILNDSNLPFQRYIDSKHFRLVRVTTSIKTEEVIKTRVHVYKKGIRLIEDILRKKAGIKNERKRTTT